jgi:phage shock protein C
MEKRLYRSESNRMLAGVCGGLGDYFKIDPTIVRLLFAVTFLIGFGSPGLLYLLLWIVMPNESRLQSGEPYHFRDGVNEMSEKTRQVVDDVRGTKREE